MSKKSKGSLKKDKTPATPAIRLLRAEGVDFTVHQYSYVAGGGTGVAAAELGLVEHAVVKTLVMEDDKGSPLLVLMHGDKEVSTKNLARAIGAKSVQPSSEAGVQRHTGYMVGGVSPFGTRKALPVFVEAGILALPRIYINGGRRGLLVELDPGALEAILRATPVSVAI